MERWPIHGAGTQVPVIHTLNRNGFAARTVPVTNPSPCNVIAKKQKVVDEQMDFNQTT